jgi:ribonuclease HII
MINLCGIDEAGRGPLAGPLSVAGLRFKKSFFKSSDFKLLEDSKKITEKKREYLYGIIKENSYYHIVMTSNNDIDNLGISLCLQNSIKEIMNNVEAGSYLMDGNTAFGIEGLDFKIKADQSVKEVSAASILAKVTRDRYMKEISSDYPNYDFHQHKGYGTKSHIQAIRKYGFSDLHRVSYKIKALEN